MKRTGDRAWRAELEWLTAKGYRPAINGLDERVVSATTCSRCGHHRLEYRGFTIARIVNRSYALCDMCKHWFEF